MFIKKLTINNFRLFPSENTFEVNNINIPDNNNEGTGLTIFVGENGCGKTAMLDALSFPLLNYKAEGFSLNDFNDPSQRTEIEIFSEDVFTVDGTMPKSSFQAKGFTFEAGIRARGNKNFLSSMIVSDQRYIKTDPNKPKDGSPDLRVSVNNPFKGQRFNENDVLFLDKNRLFQTRTGTYNTTRFDRLMEDFNYQYIKQKADIVDNLDDELSSKIHNSVENEFLDNAIRKFKEISGSDITLSLIDNWKPFNQGFFAKRKVNNQQIHLNMLGSGYEMIFSLLYSFYLSQQSGKQLIVLLDEPELHFHPALQEAFVKVLLEFSKTSQIILTTHSPLLVKQLFYNDQIKTYILRKSEATVDVLSTDQRLLPYVSANEINFLAFGLPTEEYHNELYEELKYIHGDSKSIKVFDGDYFIKEKNEKKDSPWKGNSNEVSIHTFIRNQIHHQKDNGKTDPDNLKRSIEKMRGFLAQS